MLALPASAVQGQQRAGVMSKQSKFVRYITANPPKQKGGTQYIGQQSYQAAEDAIAAAEAAKVEMSGAHLSRGSGSSSDGVDSDSSDGAEADVSSGAPEPEQQVVVHQTELLDAALADGGWKTVISTLKSNCKTADGLLEWLQRVGGTAIAAEVEASAV